MIKFNGKTDSVVNEWLGSHIYEKLGFPVQETTLGTLDGKPVVACCHIYGKGEYLHELYGMIKNINDDFFEYFSSGGKISDIIRMSEILKNVKSFSEINLNEFFWDVFVADAFIANTDRNPTNIGLIYNTKDRLLRIAPVYDNGSSFNSRMTEKMMKNTLVNWYARRNSFLNSSCPYELGDKELSPLKYIYENPCDDCIAAIGRVIPCIDLAECVKPVLKLKDAGVISRVQSTFYIASMKIKYYERLLPAYEKHFGPLHKKTLQKTSRPRFTL